MEVEGSCGWGVRTGRISYRWFSNSHAWNDRGTSSTHAFGRWEASAAGTRSTQNIATPITRNPSTNQPPSTPGLESIPVCVNVAIPECFAKSKTQHERDRVYSHKNQRRRPGAAAGTRWFRWIAARAGNRLKWGCSLATSWILERTIRRAAKIVGSLWASANVKIRATL